ncbi:MAG: chloride channel protein [Candidatus Polarisedimenticolia bacterium]
MRLADWPPIAYFRSRPPGEKRFLVLVPLTGLATGLASVAMIRLLAALQKVFWGSGRELMNHALQLPPWYRFFAPVVGGLLIALIVLVYRRSVRGHGTAAVVEAVARRDGALSMRDSLVKALATLITVASGGSLGREGPMVRVGASLASLVGGRFRLGGNRLKILIGCGAASGIAAAYNAPIGGAMFALEVILGNFALESFGPIVVASAVGTVVARAFVGNYTAYTVPPHATLVSGWELLHYLVMGLLIGVASALFIVTLKGTERGFDRLRLPDWAKPILGFALVGLIGMRFPHVLGNGFDTVNAVLHESLPLTLILVLPLLKVAATALTAGSGGAGGLFTPTLFTGSVLGYIYGAWCHEAFPDTTSTPGAYALVGMGAMVAGTTQVPLTAIMMIFELTGDYEILLPLMVACTVSIVASRALHHESIYTGPLVERGVRLGGRMEELVMDQIQVGDIMRMGAPPVRADDPLEKVLKRMLEEGRKELFVVDVEGRLVGAITLAELSEYLNQPDRLSSVKAGDVVYSDVPMLNFADRMSEAIDRWAKVSRDRLPVVAGPGSRRFVGELSAGDIIALYSQEILHKEARLARFERLREGMRPETTYVELPPEYVVALVTLPMSFAGMTLRDLGARQRFGVNIIEVKRPLGPGQERRIIPDPTTELRPGDGLIVVGRPADLGRLSDPVRLAEIGREAEGGGGSGAGSGEGAPPAAG